MSSQMFQSDTFLANDGDLEITFIGHASVMINYNGKIIHIDPFSHVADYSQFPDADLLLITHEHRDHFDLEAIGHVQKLTTISILTESCARHLPGGFILKNDEFQELGWIKVQAVPAYNLIHMRENGQPYHPRGVGNGYILSLGGKRIYIAGDTENIPEMKKLRGIDIAFLPMNLPYTMTPEMVADAVLGFKPTICYPYHFSSTETNQLLRLLDGTNVDVRIRNLA